MLMFATLGCVILMSHRHVWCTCFTGMSHVDVCHTGIFDVDVCGTRIFDVYVCHTGMSGVDVSQGCLMLIYATQGCLMLLPHRDVSCWCHTGISEVDVCQTEIPSVGVTQECLIDECHTGMSHVDASCWCLTGMFPCSWWSSSVGVTSTCSLSVSTSSRTPGTLTVSARNSSWPSVLSQSECCSGSSFFFFCVPSCVSGVHRSLWDFLVCDCFFNPTIDSW